MIATANFFMAAFRDAGRGNVAGFYQRRDDTGQQTSPAALKAVRRGAQASVEGAFDLLLIAHHVRGRFDERQRCGEFALGVARPSDLVQRHSVVILPLGFAASEGAGALERADRPCEVMSAVEPFPDSERGVMTQGGRLKR